MVDRRRRFLGLRVLVLGASIIVIIAGLKAGKTLLIPFLFALFFAAIGMAPLGWLQRRRLPTGLSVVLVALLMVAIFVALATLLGTAANEFTGKLPGYHGQLNALTVSLNEWLSERGFRTASAVLLDELSPVALMGMFGTALGGVVATLSKTVLVIVLMIFMLIEAAAFRDKLRAAVGSVVELDRFENMGADVQRYLGIKTATSATTGLLIWFLVTAVGVDFPVLWGLVAFLLNYIPFIGSIIASIPAILLALVELGPGPAATLGVGYIITNMLISYYLEPVLMGRRLKLSPLVVLLSLFFWGWVWGPAGALMSVPLTMIVKILLEHSREFRWIAVLMDTRPPVVEEGETE